MTPFNETDIRSMQATFAQYHDFSGRLADFLEPVARKLDFDGVSSVSVSDDTVSFIAFWDGPYQSHDWHCFTFPVSMLVLSQELIASHLRKIREEEARNAQEVRQQKQEAEERAKYEQLRSKFDK